LSDRPLSADEIRSMNLDERLRLLRELRLELIRLKTQAQSGTLTNVARIKMLRKNIARILTIINQERVGR